MLTYYLLAVSHAEEIVRISMRMSGDIDSFFCVLQGGKVITFTLLNANGKTICTQPVWAQWDYDVAGLLGESSHLLTVLPDPVCMRLGNFVSSVKLL